MDVMSLHSILSSYGDIIKLDYKFDIDETIKQLKTVPNWISAVNNKTAINLTGPIEDLGLDSPPEIKHAKNQQYNGNLDLCPNIKSFFDLWSNLARCRAVIMKKGSFFRPHRDAYRLNDQFRIFIPLNKTKDSDWIFFYNGKIERFEEGVPYILNTRKIHGSFAMADDIYHIIMSIYLNEQNLKQIIKMLPDCEEN